MTDVFVGWFKRAFPVSGNLYELITQLSTGTLTFDYKAPGDDTLKSSTNNVSGKNSINTQGTCSASIAWIYPDNSNGVCFNQWIRDSGGRDEKAPGPAIEVPPVHREIYDGSTIFGGKSFISKVRASDLTPYGHMGGAHLQNINAVDYIVLYEIEADWPPNVIIKKHIALYDENLDQTLITDMTYDSTVTYSNATQESIRSESIDGIDVRLIMEQNRQLVTNQDGTRTIFFCDIKDSSGIYGNDYDIVEIIDDGVTFAVQKYGEFIKQDEPNNPIINTDTVTGAEIYIESAIVDRTLCPDNYVVTVAGNVDANGTESASSSQNKSIKSKFLGCAYDKFTDEVLMLSFNTYQVRAATQRNQNWSGSGEGANITDSINHIDFVDPNNTFQALCVNGIDVVHTDSIFSESGDVTVTGATSSGSTTLYSFNSTLGEYHIIDLSSRLFLYTKNERTLGGTYNYSDINYYVFDDRGSSYDKTYIHANGLDTEILSVFERDWGTTPLPTTPLATNTRGLARPVIDTVYTGDWPPPSLNCTSTETSWSYTRTDNYLSPVFEDYDQ